MQKTKLIVASTMLLTTSCLSAIDMRTPKNSTFLGKQAVVTGCSKTKNQNNCRLFAGDKLRVEGLVLKIRRQNERTVDLSVCSNGKEVFSGSITKGFSSNTKQFTAGQTSVDIEIYGVGTLEQTTYSPISVNMKETIFVDLRLKKN